MTKTAFITSKLNTALSYVLFAVALIFVIQLIDKDVVSQTFLSPQVETTEKTAGSNNVPSASQSGKQAKSLVWKSFASVEYDDNLSKKIQLKPTFQKYLHIRQACFAVLDVFAGKQSLQYKIFYSNIALDFINVHFASFNGIKHSDQVDLQQLLEELRDKLKLQANGQLETEEIAADEILPRFGNWLKLLKEKFFDGDIFGKHWSECRQKLDYEKKRIWEQLDKLQEGSTCLEWKKANQFKRDLRNRIGLGSQFHRMGQCLATGLETNTTCFVVDEAWNYHPGNYRKYFKNADHCAPISSFKVRPDYESTRPWSQLLKNVSLPSFPDFLWDKLAHCHEDLAAWYAGVLIRFAMEPTEMARDEVEKLQEKQDLGENFAAIQIRSIDEFSNMIEPDLYTKYLKMATKFDKRFSEIKKAWIATDQQINIDKIKAEKSQFHYASWEAGYFESARFKGEVEHLIGLLTDVNIVLKAPLVIGRMGSNLIRFAYEYRSVDDPLAIESLLSLDMLYHMVPNWVNLKFNLYDSSLILSAPIAPRNPDFLSAVEGLKLSGLCGDTKTVEVSDNKQPHIPSRDGFREISVKCGGVNKSRAQKAYVPMYVLQRVYYTYQRHRITQLQTVFIGDHA